MPLMHKCACVRACVCLRVCVCCAFSLTLFLLGPWAARCIPQSRRARPQTQREISQQQKKCSPISQLIWGVERSESSVYSFTCLQHRFFFKSIQRFSSTFPSMFWRLRISRLPERLLLQHRKACCTFCKAFFNTSPRKSDGLERRPEPQIRRWRENKLLLLACVQELPDLSSAAKLRGI